jgi:6-phosphogluconate dehydrogenase
MSKIGFIGLGIGIMGAPMAHNLQQAGHTLFLHSRSGVKDKALLISLCDSGQTAPNFWLNPQNGVGYPIVVMGRN